MLTALAESPYLKSEWRLFPIVWHWASLMDNRLFPQDSVFLSPWKAEMEVCTRGWKPKGDRMKVNSGRKLRERRVGYIPCWTWHNHNSTATTLQRAIVSECTFWLGQGSDRPVCEGQSFPHNTLHPLAIIWPHWASPETWSNLQKSAKLKFIHLYAIIHYTTGSTLDIFISAKRNCNVQLTHTRNPPLNNTNFVKLLDSLEQTQKVCLHKSQSKIIRCRFNHDEWFNQNPSLRSLSTMCYYEAQK